MPQDQRSRTSKPMLVLASASSYRKALLARLDVSFTAQSANIEEYPIPGETPPGQAIRLAEAKARAVASTHPCALIIGSDQVAVLDDQRLGKPGSYEQAVQQLRRASGKTLHFYTALCLYNSLQGRVHRDVVTSSVRFRQLSETMIERYLQQEPAFDCAGAFKSEGLGISLLEKMSGDDPTALIGLPLIRLSQMLLTEGVDVLAGTD